MNLWASASDLLGVEELGDVEVLHLARDHVRRVGGWIPVGDLRDAAAAFGERCPHVVDGVADRRDDAESGDDDASRVIWFAHGVAPFLLMPLG